MGGVIGGIGKGIGGIGAVKESIGGIAGAIHGEIGGVGTILQSVVGNLNTTLTQLEQLGKGGPFSGGAGQQLLGSFQSDLARLAYIAALQKAMLKARGTGSFNVETAINDLWVALDGIRKGRQLSDQQTQLAQQAQQANDLLQAVSKIMKQMHDTAGSAIQNMRG